MSEVARTVHDLMSSAAMVKDLYTARGTHEGCGQCCGRFLPLFPHEAVRLRHVARDVAPRPEQPGVIDMNCPFLTDGDMCAVYDDRPTICRVYDCSEHARKGAAFAAELAHGGLEPGMEIYDMREIAGSRERESR